MLATLEEKDRNMASRRLLIAAVTPDALAAENIRDVPDGLNRVSLWATAVNVADEIGLTLDRTEIMAPGTANVSAAATGMVDTGRDQLVFESLVGGGKLKIPVPIVTASVIVLISVEPVVPGVN